LAEDPVGRITRVRVVVTGRVQGVSFRSSLMEVARRYRVQGWVKNNPDGSLEAVLQGREENLSHVLDWARHGPPGAVVTELKTELLEPSTDVGDFQIRL
jgi:acylphosphatase